MKKSLRLIFWLLPLFISRYSSMIIHTELEWIQMFICLGSVCGIIIAVLQERKSEIQDRTSLLVLTAFLLLIVLPISCFLEFYWCVSLSLALVFRAVTSYNALLLSICIIKFFLTFIKKNEATSRGSAH